MQKAVLVRDERAGMHTATITITVTGDNLEGVKEQMRDLRRKFDSFGRLLDRDAMHPTRSFTEVRFDGEEVDWSSV